MIKLLTIIFMTLDHYAAYLHPNILYRALGRTVMPLMIYQLHQGTIYTKNLNNYKNRLLITGLLAQIPHFLLGHHTFNSVLNYYIIIALYQQYKQIQGNGAGGIDAHIKRALLFTLFIGALGACDYGNLPLLLFIACKLFKNQLDDSLIKITTYKCPRSLRLWHFIPTNHTACKIFKTLEQYLPKIKKYIYYIYYPTHLYIIYLIKK